MNSPIMNIFIPIILFLYAIPTFFSWETSNPFMKVSAVFAGITGLASIAGIILRQIKEKQNNNTNDVNSDVTGHDDKE